MTPQPGGGRGRTVLDWNDLRYFLAVAETGSTLAAGRKLKVSQTTAARRIAALEESLGLALFERRQSGYALTPAGEALVEQARAVESSAAHFADAAAAQSRDVSGAVRLTASDIYAVTVLVPMLRDLHEAQPGVRIELVTSDFPLDLDAGEADVAMRASVMPKGAGLVARRIAPDPWTLYCSRDYAARHRRPHTAEDLRRHPIIGGGGEKIWPVYRAWLRRYDLEDAVVMEHGSATGLLAAVRAGAGMAVLPSFMADRDPDLVQCLPPMKHDEVALWLMTHERLRRTPRVRAVMDFLGDRLTQLARTPPSNGGEALWLPER
jgi:DNA-binding transcriptional LysR family regulator